MEKDFHLRRTPTQNLLKKDLKTARILFKILEILMQDDHEHELKSFLVTNSVIGEFGPVFTLCVFCDVTMNS